MKISIKNDHMRVCWAKKKSKKLFRGMQCMKYVGRGDVEFSVEREGSFFNTSKISFAREEVWLSECIHMCV